MGVRSSPADNHSVGGHADAMAYRNAQLDEHCNSPRARKVEKRGSSRKTRQSVRSAVRNGIDALDDMARRSMSRRNGWAS